MVIIMILNIFEFFPGSNHITNKESNFDNYIYRFAKENWNSSYSSLSVALEHKALATVIKKNIKLVHYWFGDHDYYYGYWFKRIFEIKLVVNLFSQLKATKKNAK